MLLPTVSKSPSLKSHHSWFSVLLFLVLVLLLVLSFHVREVVQKANKEERLRRYGEELTEVSRTLEELQAEVDSLAVIYRRAKEKAEKVVGKQTVLSWKKNL